MEATIFQMIQSRQRLLGYASKKLPDASKTYDITGPELCGQAVNI